MHTCSQGPSSHGHCPLSAPTAPDLLISSVLQDSRELADNSSESSDLQLEGPSSLGVLDDGPSNSLVEDKPLVFFDLKIDNESGFSGGHPSTLSCSVPKSPG